MPPLTIIAVMLLAALLIGCARELSPSEQALQTTGMLKAACVDACAAPPGQVFPITITPPVGSSLYTTSEAACIRYGEPGSDGLGKRLVCARCPCRVEGENITNITTPLLCVVTALPEEPMSRIAIACSTAYRDE